LTGGKKTVSVTWYIVFGAIWPPRVELLQRDGAADTDGDGICDALDNCSG
jgi:hypothetical protein